MELEKLKLNKHEVYDFMDVRDYLGCKEYDRFLMWLMIDNKINNRWGCPFGVKPELLEEYLEALKNIEDKLEE